MSPSRRVSAQRLAAQRISSPVEGRLRDLVAWLGAVQAQDFGAVRWAVGLRLPGAPTDAGIEAAISDGEVIRTHAMRGTWQLVAPEDLRWLLALVGPLVVARMTPRMRELGLDGPTLRRCHAALERALAEGPKTRAEIVKALARVRIAAGERLSHVLGHAELVGLACSGPRRGKQSTHVLLDTRVPAGGPVDLDEAAATLALRYFRSHGPATLGDFVWWSSLPAARAKAALESIGSRLVETRADGRVLFGGEAPRRVDRRAFLLPTFDEYLVAYKNREDVLAPAHVHRINAGGGLLAPCVVVGGRVVATWKRTLDRDAVSIAIRFFGRPTHDEARRTRLAAERYARFLGLEPRIRMR